jgi:hypothetical protein
MNAPYLTGRIRAIALRPTPVALLELLSIADSVERYERLGDELFQAEREAAHRRRIIAELVKPAELA